MTTIPDNLPPRFLNWRMEDDRKVPCRRDGTKCNAHDPANHLTCADAHAAALASGYGVAFDLRAEDGYFFLDLDKCRDDAGEWSVGARSIYHSFNGAWYEVSQSGKGLHILGRCDPSRLTDRRNKWDGWLEFYTTGRFIAFGSTGWAPINGPATNQDWTNQLLHLVPEREHLGELPDGVDPNYTGPADDADLIALMLRSLGGAGAAFKMRASVADLWNADAAVLSRIYPRGDGFDHSSADAALMSHLAFWTGKDMPRMDRLFRLSKLVREKYTTREDYRRETVQGAARLCQKVYDRPRKMPGMKPVPTATATGTEAVAAAAEVYMTIPEMRTHFKDCIYISDMHRVMVPDGRMLRSEQFNAIFGGHEFQMMPDGTKPTDEAFKALTQNKATRFPQAIRPCFRPDLPRGLILPDGSVNTYVPPNVSMIEGDVTPFLDLMAKMLPVERDRMILLSYMAAVVQHPGVKFQWAPVLQGCEGNGKTAVFSTLIHAVGEHNTFQPSAKQIGGQFNGYLENKVFILVEEFHMQGRRDVLDDLKPLITNRQIKVESKGVDQRMIQNLANWAFCTNYKDAVLKSRNDRRYAVFFTAQQSVADLARDKMNGRYFPNLIAWLQNGGGYSAVAHYLANYSIPAEFDPTSDCHRAPETSSTDESIEESLGAIEQQILEAAQDNTVGFRAGWVSSWALDKLLRDRGYKIGPKRVPTILEALGYKKAGRATKPIIEEDGKKPVLYKLPSVTDGIDGYGRAQHYASQ